MRDLPTSSPPLQTLATPPGRRHHVLLSRTALLPQIGVRVPGDLPNQMRPNFARWCALMCSTTYPKISSKGYPRRPGSKFHRLLSGVLLGSSTQNGTITLVPPNLKFFSLHKPLHIVFPDVIYVFPKGFAKIHPDAPRNACGVRTATGRVCRVYVSRSPIQVTIN